MFTGISRKRLLFYLMVVGFIPLVFYLFNIFSSMQRISSLNHQLSFLEEQLLHKKNKRSINSSIEYHFKNADKQYIDNTLEKLSLLESQKKAFISILNNPNFTGDDTVKKRVEFLEGKDNKIVFTETSVQNLQGVKETIETLSHPVEIDLSDLKKILSIVEGAPSAHEENPPQLFFLDFSLTRKNISEKTDNYILNMKLLKREFP